MILLTPSHHAAGDIPNRARDPGRFVRQQKCNRFGNFFGASDTADWVETVETLKNRIYLFFRNETLRVWGAHDGRRYRLHSNASARKLHSKMLRQALQSALRHRGVRRASRSDRLLAPP